MKKSLIIFSLILSILFITGCNEENKYNITFYMGNEIYQVIESTGEIKFPTDPEKAGYEFAGWYFDTSFNSVASGNISKDTSIYAKFNLLTYSITYELDGGVNDNNNPTSYTIETANLSLKPASKEGYNFAGWYLNDIKVETIDNTLLKDITLTATYSLNEYTISYNLDGGINNELNITTYSINDSSFELLEPTKEGYEFLGWYDESENKITTIDTSLCVNLSLTAKWDLVTYTITYNTDGGFNSSNNPLTYNVLNVVTFEGCDKTGYDFVAWVDQNGNEITSTEGLTENLVLTATYTIAYYTVSFVDYAGNTVGKVENVQYNTRISSLPTFNYDDSLTVEYYHYYRKTWTVFNYKLDKIEGNTTVYLNVYNKGTSYSLSENMINGYSGNVETLYIPWIINGTEVTSIGLDVFSSHEFSKVIIPQNIKAVNARAFKDCNIREIEGLEHLEFIGPSAFSGNNLTSVTFGENIETISELGFANNENLKTIYFNKTVPFEFNATAFENDYIIYLPNNCYSVYIENEAFLNVEEHLYEEGKIKVTYNYLNNVRKALINKNEKFIPENFEIEGYDIVNFYLDSSYSTPVENKKYTEDFEVYCKLTYHNYNISYNLNGGRFNEVVKETFTMEEEVELTNPVKDGYIFIGWFTNDELTDNAVVKIEQGTTKDINLFAKYIVDEENEYVDLTVIDIDGISTYVVKPVIKNININDVYFDLYNDYIVEFYTLDETNSYTLFTGEISSSMTLYVNYYTEGFDISLGVVSKYNGTTLENVVIPWIYKGLLVEQLGAGSYTSIFMDSNTRESINVTSVYVPRTIKEIKDYAFYSASPKMEIYMLGSLPKVGNNFVTLYPTSYIYVLEQYYDDYKASFIGTNSYYDYTVYVLKQNEFVITFADYFEQETGMVRSEYSRVVSTAPIIPDKPENPESSNAEFEGWYLDIELTEKYNFDTELTKTTILYPKFITKTMISLYDFNTGASLVNSTVFSNAVVNAELLKTLLKETFVENVTYEIYTRASYDNSTGKYIYNYVEFNQEISVAINQASSAIFYITYYDAGLVVENDTVVSYNGNASVLVVPTFVKNITITKIGNKAFENNKTLTEITLPETINLISDEAFSGCEELRTLNILSKTAPLVGNNVFHNTTSLTIIPANNEGYNSESWQQYQHLVSTTAKVTFMYNDLPYEELLIILGEKVASPTNNPADNNISRFGGWYVDAECTIEFDFENTIINEDTIIYGKYISAVGLSVYLNGEYFTYYEVFAGDIVLSEIFTEYEENITPGEGQTRKITLVYTSSSDEEITINVELDVSVFPEDYKYGIMYIVIE